MRRRWQALSRLSTAYGRSPRRRESILPPGSYGPDKKVRRRGNISPNSFERIECGRPRSLSWSPDAYAASGRKGSNSPCARRRRRRDLTDPPSNDLPPPLKLRSLWQETHALGAAPFSRSTTGSVCGVAHPVGTAPPHRRPPHPVPGVCPGWWCRRGWGCADREPTSPSHVLNPVVAAVSLLCRGYASTCWPSAPPLRPP